MLEIKVDVIVKCPDLLVALEKLNTCACKKEPVLNDLVNRQPEVSNIYPTPMPSQTILPTTITAEGPAPQTQLVDVPAPAPVAPVATPPTEAPSFTLAQIAKAGADLVTSKPALQPQLVALLGKYGAETVVGLKPDDFGAFAAELRGLGAKI